MNKKTNINININGYDKKFTISPEQEQAYQCAAALLNKKIDEYSASFDMPREELLTLVAYEIAVEYKISKHKEHTP